jgi:hypothetical protein
MSNQVRHAMSYPFMCRSCRAMPRTPYPIPDSEFGNPESGTPEPRAWSGPEYSFHLPHFSC